MTSILRAIVASFATAKADKRVTEMKRSRLT